MEDERMQAIFNLDVTKKFILELFKFVSSFSILEERLRTELAAKDHSACFKTTMEICSGLKRIYAGDLADGFYQTLQTLKSREHEEVEMYLADFLVYVAMLSMDIQMALFRHDTAKSGVQEEIMKTGPAAKLQVEKDLILAVDDTMLFLVTLKTYIKDTGFNFVSHSSIDTVVDFLTKRRPRLIFLGVDMAKMGMDGFELAAKIRELGHDAPIVFFTGNASEKNVMKAMEMGAAGFIVKPASQTSVLQIIDKIIGGLPKPTAPPKKTKSDYAELPDFAELRDLPKA